jgi:hypothetical protein
MTTTRQIIEQRGGAHRYRVTILVSDGRREVVEVPADDEWKAHTRAMALTTLTIRGQSVDYEVEEI